MQVKIELSTTDLKRLIKKYLEEKTNLPINEMLIHIEMKSWIRGAEKWSEAAFRARYEETVIK